MKYNFFLTIMCIILCSTMSAQTIKLPPPQKVGGKPLMEALNLRQSNREFSSQMLSNQQLSNLLWAANGVNREDIGKRTTPSARNSQEIDIYLFMEKGIYLYLPKTQELQFIKEGDFRGYVTMQDFVPTAPILLIMVANYDRTENLDNEGRALYCATDCGNICQNVYLYCASEGLHTVTLGSIHRDIIQELLHFNGKAILGQPIGFPK